MGNQAFSKIWTVIILVILISGGILVWQWRIKQKAPFERTMEVKVYFQRFREREVDCNCNDPVIRRIPKTKEIKAIAKATLEVLIKGPTKKEVAQGYNGCLPDEELVVARRNWYETEIVTAEERNEFISKFLSPDGKFAPWNDRIIVKDVSVKDGIAYADFSKELYSYGGGSCWVESIITSIENTLLQFPEIKKVKILVEGKEAILEP